MTENAGPLERPLGHYRVLEMPGVATLLAGKTLADLGADVIKVEPVGGDPARTLPPLYESKNGPTSLVWAACDIGKGHITADLTTPEGRRAFKGLAADADVLLESFRPGQLDAMGLGKDALRSANPGLVITSMTAFGQDGPYARWRGSDLVHLAASGYLHMTGPADGPPLKPSVPFQTYYHAAMQAVAATLIALRERQASGRGVDVDQACRDVGLWMLTHTYQYWDMQRINLRRLGASRDMGAFRRLRVIYRCRDGHVVWLAATGHIGGPSVHALVGWMHEQGMAPEWLRAIDWRSFDYVKEGVEVIERLEEQFAAFFLTRTKAELLEWALANRLMLSPLQDLQDVIDDPQLAARAAWRQLSVDEMRPPVRIPGPPVRLSGALWQPRLEDAAPGRARWRPRERSRSRAPEALAGRLPLAGLRVIDFSTTLAGPTASRHLADFGAEVIRVESSTHPDTIRAGTPYAGNQAGLNRSGYFGAYNAGKKSIALNMQKPRSIELVRRLLLRADILLEAFVPGVMERWGLDWDQVHALNPRLIMASHCLQGQSGPRSGHRGYGQIAAAMTGWYDLTGLPSEDAVGPYSAYTDFICWPYLLTAMLVALEARDQTGVGMRIDHAQVETSVHFMAPLLLDLQLNGHLARRRGNHEDFACPNNAFLCAGDGRWLAVTVASDAEWRSFCAVLGHGAAAADSRFATLAARKQHEGELEQLVSAWTGDRDAWQMAEALQAAGVAASVVLRAEDLFADPQLRQRRFFRRLQHTELGDHAVLTPSFRLSGIEPGPFSAAPLLGEHTAEVCSGLLGLSADEIADYAADGVFE
jgi:crotonobetainyl-CoA:carnitine CoA-transferase CaiB-like acyl-CoA transferase